MYYVPIYRILKYGSHTELRPTASAALAGYRGMQCSPSPLRKGAGALMRGTSVHCALHSPVESGRERVGMRLNGYNPTHYAYSRRHTTASGKWRSPPDATGIIERKAPRVVTSSGVDGALGQSDAVPPLRRHAYRCE